MENKISVCIPCIQKHIPFLSSCVASINKQTILPIEIVISISNIENLEAMKNIEIECEKIINSSKIPIKIKYTYEKKYAGENRNICVQEAEGNVVSFIDADDLMHKDRIKILTEIFDKYKDYIGVLHYFVENTSLDNEEKFDEKNIQKYSFTELLHFGHSSFRKKIFEKYKYGSDHRGQDVKFVASILPEYMDKILIYKRPLTFYMSNNSSYWNKNL
jgi:glycosyltransferase involved in cell wall biosynthesis